MLYDAFVITSESEHTFQNIEAKSEQHLTNSIRRDLDDEIIEIEIKKVLEERIWNDGN